MLKPTLARLAFATGVREDPLERAEPGQPGGDGRGVQGPGQAGVRVPQAAPRRRSSFSSAPLSNPRLAREQLQTLLSLPWSLREMIFLRVAFRS